MTNPLDSLARTCAHHNGHAFIISGFPPLLITKDGVRVCEIDPIVISEILPAIRTGDFVDADVCYRVQFAGVPTSAIFITNAPTSPPGNPMTANVPLLPTPQIGNLIESCRASKECNALILTSNSRPLFWAPSGVHAYRSPLLNDVEITSMAKLDRNLSQFTEVRGGWHNGSVVASDDQLFHINVFKSAGISVVFSKGGAG